MVLFSLFGEMGVGGVGVIDGVSDGDGEYGGERGRGVEGEELHGVVVGGGGGGGGGDGGGGRSLGE